MLTLCCSGFFLIKLSDQRWFWTNCRRKTDEKISTHLKEDIEEDEKTFEAAVDFAHLHLWRSDSREQERRWSGSSGVEERSAKNVRDVGGASYHSEHVQQPGGLYGRDGTCRENLHTAEEEKTFQHIRIQVEMFEDAATTTVTFKGTSQRTVRRSTNKCKNNKKNHPEEETWTQFSENSSAFQLNLFP